MLTFKSLKDVKNAHMPSHIRNCVLQEMEQYIKTHPNYSPNADGYVVALISSPNNPQIERLFGHTWNDISWEAVTYDVANKCYIALYLFNNQFSITLVLDGYHPASYLPCIQEQIIRYI